MGRAGGTLGAVPGDPVIVPGDYNAAEARLASRFMRGVAAIEGTATPLPLLDMMPGATALAAEIDRTNDADRYPSDHCPITATLRLPDRAASAGQP